MFKTLRYIFYRFADICLSKLHMLRLIKTSVGIKILNASSFRNNTPYKIIGGIELSSQELFMGMDYLQDDYSLVDICLADTPHFSFMKDLDEGKNMSQSDYIVRFQKGALDARYPYKHVSDFSMFVQKFNCSKKQILSGEYPPVQVYKIGEKYYLFDGKHRAALCAYLHLPVKCNIIDANAIIGQNSKAIIEMMKNNTSFSRNIDFYNSALEKLSK